MDAAGPSRLAAQPRRRSRCWLVLNDPCGYVCVLTTHVMAWGTASLVNLYILLPRLHGLLSMLHLLWYNYVIAALLVAHSRCMLTNPGTAKDHLEQELNEVMHREHRRQAQAGPPTAAGAMWGGQGRREAYRRKWWCSKCETFRPKHTHHCSTCRACVLEMDHHCPWVNNCIGWRNHKYFVLFLVYAWIGCVWSVFCIILGLINPAESSLRLASEVFYNEFGNIDGLPDGNDRGRAFPSHWRALIREWVAARFGKLHRCLPAQIGCIIMCVICFLMLIFVAVMGCDQCEHMKTGYGIVDKKLLAKERLEQGDDAADMKAAKRKASAKLHRGCATRCCGDKLPDVMGASDTCGLRWWLPVAPGLRELADVPEDELISSARRKYREDLISLSSQTSGLLASGHGGRGVVGAGEPRSSSAPPPLRPGLPPAHMLAAPQWLRARRRVANEGAAPAGSPLQPGLLDAPAARAGMGGMVTSVRNASGAVARSQSVPSMRELAQRPHRRQAADCAAAEAKQTLAQAATSSSDSEDSDESSDEDSGTW